MQIVPRKPCGSIPGYKEIMGDLPDDAAHIDCTVDLVTDLLHLAKMKWQADPDYILRVARMHFDAEQGGEMQGRKRESLQSQNRL